VPRSLLAKGEELSSTKKEMRQKSDDRIMGPAWLQTLIPWNEVYKLAITKQMMPTKWAYLDG
jgi:hypothetical protein